MARRIRGDGTLFKRSDGYWVVGVELPPGTDGKRRQRRIVRKSRNEALAALRKAREDAAAGKIAASSKATVSQWLERWITDIYPLRDVKPSTVQQYERVVRNHLIPNIGAKRLDKLTPADIRAMHKHLTDTISGRAAQKAHQVLSLALKAAIREEIIYSNLLDRVDKPVHVQKEAQSFDAATATRIIAAAEDTQGVMWGARWAFGFLTGAREAEILGMEWNRVDFDRGVVDVSWQLKRFPKRHGCGDPAEGRFPCGFSRPAYCPDAVWKYRMGEHRELSNTLCLVRPKTKAGRRIIPLIPALAVILRRIELDSPNPHGLVFHHPDGRPIDQEQDQKAWAKLLRSAQIPHVNQHTIRHSTATLLMEANTDVHVIQKVIGHTDIATTRGYQHVNLELARRAWNSLEELIPKPLT